MSPLPVRVRVAWWSAIATGTALLAFAAGTLANLVHEQIEEVDLKLVGAARRLNAADAGEREGEVSHEARELEYEPWLAAAVFAADGRLLVDSSRVPESIARAAQGHTRPTTLHAHEGDWRVLSVSENDQTVVLAFDLEEVNDIVADLLTGYLIALPIAAGIAALGGWIVAGRALHPVRLATEAAAGITPSRLDQRLPVPPVRDEIADLARVINSMLERMERSFRQAERFAADASHEIRTPLTIIKGEVEAALRTADLASPIQTHLLSVQEEIARLQRVTEQLLLLARLDAGAAQLRREPVDLARLVRGACEDVELVASQQAIAVDASAVDEAEVLGDEEQLRRVVLNLLDNACKFNERGGRIVCTLRCARDTVDLRVANTGAGIPAELHPHLFQRFFRANAARSRGGHGLGLSLSREIVQAHGGSLELMEPGGSGLTEFRVVLPAKAG
ncbi:MAG: HAMP domain-containing protein [Opitutaceae bacterium]|nr:HAMP domain-containing protein [Opitutaceae bacterium]